MSDPAPKCSACGKMLDLTSSRCPGCGRDVADQAPTEAGTGPRPSAAGPQSLIGEFRILRTIGSGGMGIVYEAYQESMHRRVALKVLNVASPLSSTDEARFEREAWVAGSLSHPNIVKVYGQGTVGATRYIAMELVEGESLAAAIRETKANRASHPESDSTLRSGHIRKTVSLFVELADALQHVHERHIVHRDIKPSNLLLTKDLSRLLLTDFGLARDEAALQLTQHGDFMGTVGYMSPEQLLAQRVRVDHRTDIWSLGISLYEAVTLELPFSCDTQESYITAVSMREPIPAAIRNRAVPHDLETVLMKCLQRDPERRYATASDLKDDLARFLEGRPVLARRPGVILKTGRLVWRHRLAVGAALLTAVLALAIVGVLIHWRQHQTEIERIRWTLQQVIDNPKSEPDKLQADWAHLLGTLQQEVRRHPHGDLALLAQRAACRVTVKAEPFGLVSMPARLFVDVHSGVDPGREFLNVVSVEGSLDDGPWVPIASVVWQEKDERSSSGYAERLDGYFPANKLTPAPHVIKCRVNFRLFDPDNLPAAVKNEFLKQNVVFGGSEKVWPMASKAVPLFTETRTLETVTTNLFTEYPKDFPRRVFFTEATRPPQPWFQLDRVRIVRVKLPPGRGSGFSVLWPEELAEIFPGRKQTYCAPKNSGRLNNPVVSIEFFGRLERFEIAADASLWSDQNPKALLSFPVVWPSDGSLRHLGDASGFNQMAGPGQPSASSPSPKNQSTNDGAILPNPVQIWRYNLAIFAGSGSSLPLFPDGIEDGAAPGRIDFAPSRSIALEEGFSSYLGEKVSVRIPSLEIRTVPGEWTQKEGCH